MYKLKSVDIWDTVLRRNSHPDCSKLHTAKFLLLNLYNEIKEEYRSKERLFQERCKIEGELARKKEAAGKDGEYTLNEVLESLVKRVADDASAVVVSTIVQELVDSEINFEVENTYVDPTIIAELERFNSEKTIYLSDFYMCKDQLEKILCHHGILDVFDDGVVSCDVGLNKASGRLFSYVHKVYGVSPSEHVHIGDNKHSDVKIPAGLGVEVIHFLPEGEHEKRGKKESYFHDREIFFRDAESTIRTSLSSEIDDSANSEAFGLGVKLSPFFVGYALFILEVSKKEKLDKILFMTREGEFFKRVYHALFDNEQGVEADLIEVSRLSTFCASLPSITADNLMRMWSLYSSQSISAMCKSLDINVEDVAAISNKHSLDLEEIVVYPWQDERFLSFLSDAEFQEVAEPLRLSKLSGLKSYSASKLENASSVGVVDIGWRGTIQDNLAHVFPNTKFTGFYLGLSRFLNVQPPNVKKFAYGPDLNLDDAEQFLLDNVSLIEMICNSPNGSVIGYKLGGEGKMIADRNVSSAENETFYRYTDFFQQGVIQACSLWKAYVHENALTNEDFRNYFMAGWRFLAKSTPLDLIDEHRSLSHNEIFGVGKFVEIISTPSLKSLLKGVFIKSERQVVIEFISRNQSVRYMLANKQVAGVKRVLWASVIFVALLYKRTFLERKRAQQNR